MSDVVSAPDFVQPASIDFNSLYEKAMEHPSDPTANASAESPASSVDVAPSLTSTQLKPDLSPERVEGKVFDIPDEALVKVKIDGAEQTVPYKEYKDGIQREAAFTKRMQQLADQRREAETVFTQRAAELQRQAEMLAYAQQQLQQQANPVQQLQQLLAQQNQPEQKSDPNEIATLGEVQQSLSAFQQQLQQQQAAQQQAFMQQLQEAGLQLRAEQELHADAMKFTTALNSTLEKDDFKMLRDVIPYADESIRFQVAQLNPETIDEAIGFAEQVAKEWADKVRAVNNDYLTRQEVAKARAKMEPPSGSPPPPRGTKPQQAFKRNGQIDWNILRERANSYME
jgi:hypothetical protein